MSIGNLKDSGNQGNNLPWQWKVLQGLQEIAYQTAQPLTCVEDSVTICNANIDAFTFTNILGVGQSLNVNIANTIPLEVNISAANDSIGIYGYNGSTPTPVFVNANGQVAVQGLYGEDTAHSSTNSGMFVMGVRNDFNTSMTSDNGDYSPIAVNANGAVAVNDGGNSITVDGGTGLARTPGMLRPSNTSGNVSSVAATFYSVSVANVGAGNGTVLASLTTIKPGEVLNFSADAINNYFTSFAYDATGTEFIIIYVA